MEESNELIEVEQTQDQGAEEMEAQTETEVV